MRAVHFSNFASQPDVQIACDKSWTTPKCSANSGMTTRPGVYETDDNRLYTYDHSKITCLLCKKPNDSP